MLMCALSPYGPFVSNVSRGRIKLLRIEGEFVDPQRAGVPLAGMPAADPDGQPCEKVVSFLFKYFPAAAKLELGSTASDPLGEIPVRQILTAGYGTFDNTMLPGRVVRRIRNQWRFVPKSLFKNDAFALIEPAHSRL